MTKDVEEMRTRLREIALSFEGPLRARVDKPTNVEMAGTIEAMQGKQKVDGIYFCSIVPKPKDVRFYFFPIYTHADAFANISETMRKFLKGKSCFHVKYLDEAVEADLKEMIALGIELYQKDGLLAN